MFKPTERETMIQGIADQKAMLLTFEVLEGHIYAYAKKWFAHKPREWHDLSFTAKLFTAPVILACTCFALYYTALFHLGDLAMCACQDAVAELDPTAKRTMPCDAEDALPAST